MSYSILYRAAFLKLGDGTLVPVGETGDNNVYECGFRGRYKRARSWSNCWSMFSGRLSFTEQEILSAVQKIIDKNVRENAGVKKDYEDHIYAREEVLHRFGYFASMHISGRQTCTADEFLGWFRRGIRNAHTLDEFLRNGVKVYVGSCNRENRYEEVVVRTEQELRDAYRRQKAEGRDATVRYDDIGEYTFRQLCPAASRKRSKGRDTGYIVRLADGRYVMQRTPRHFTLTSWPEYAHRYASSRDAAKVVAALEKCGNTSSVKEYTAARI